MSGLLSLPPWLDERILWGVRPWQLIVATTIVFLGFASRKLIVAFFAGVITRLTAKTSASWDDDLATLLPRPLSYAAQILLWHFGLSFLVLPEEPIDVRRYTYQGLQAALGVTVAWIALGVVDALALFLGRIAARTDSRLDDQLVPLVRKSLKLIVGVTFAITIVQNLGYSVTSVIASLGVGGLALALAAKDAVANLFGSVVVFTDRPFQIGDWVEFGDVEGTVEEVGFRTTRVRRFDKALVTVPNATFSTEAITNHSNREIRRIDLTVGVSYQTSPEQMCALLDDIRALVATHPELDQGFHFVNFTDFADSSLTIRVYCFTRSIEWRTHLRVREELMLQIMRLVAKHRLEIAFPTRTVYVRGETSAPPPSSAG